MVEKLIDLVNSSLEKSEKDEHNVTQDVFNMFSMSTPHFRKFINNLCSKPNAKYLEVGSYMGGMFCAACCNNKELTAFSIDNFSESHFGTSPSEEKLLLNLKRIEPIAGKMKFINKSSLEVTKDDVPEKINIFMYDGDHHAPHTHDNFVHYLDFLDDDFIVMVDDYDDRYENAMVRKDFERALEEKKDQLTIHKEWLMPGYNDPKWWNGLYIAVISKNKEK